MYLFDQDIALTSSEPFVLKGNISSNWLINGNPHGGHILSIIANAMSAYSEKKATPILTASYLSRCMQEELDLYIEQISESKQYNRMQARLFQRGVERVRAMGTFADEKDACFIERYEKAVPQIAPLEQCLQIPVLPKYTLYDQLDIRLDPECTGWIVNDFSEKSEQKGWAKFKDERPFDMLSIALIADSFPPSVYASQGPVGWVPTMELSVSIRNVPDTKWVKCIFKTNFINCGLMEEDGEIWDENGGLVAISRQIAQYREVE